MEIVVPVYEGVGMNEEWTADDFDALEPGSEMAAVLGRVDPAELPQPGEQRRPNNE